MNPCLALNERGVAVGYPDIRTDSIKFRYFDEYFEFPTVRTIGIAKWNGYFYEADIDDVRKLEAAGTA